LAIVVVVDEPKKSIYGGQVAAPIFRHIAESVLPYLGVSARIENDEPEWKTLEVADVASLAAAESVNGMSMREVRRFAASRGLRLNVHGSGWVIRQKPASTNGLEHGDMLEVWLNE